MLGGEEGVLKGMEECEEEMEVDRKSRALEHLR